MTGNIRSSSSDATCDPDLDFRPLATCNFCAGVPTDISPAGDEIELSSWHKEALRCYATEGITPGHEKFGINPRAPWGECESHLFTLSKWPPRVYFHMLASNRTKPYLLRLHIGLEYMRPPTTELIPRLRRRFATPRGSPYHTSVLLLVHQESTTDAHVHCQSRRGAVCSIHVHAEASHYGLGSGGKKKGVMGSTFQKAIPRKF